MKTLLKLSVTAIFFAFTTLQCTNTNNKANTIILDEKISISNDTTVLTTEIKSNMWGFNIVNNKDVNQYNYEKYPFMIFSIDSSFVLINSGCNIYIGECTFNPGQKVSFDKIRIKEEICPIGALEREIIYMLDITNNYSLNNDTLILYNNENPVGISSIYNF